MKNILHTIGYGLLVALFLGLTLGSCKKKEQEKPVVDPSDTTDTTKVERVFKLSVDTLEFNKEGGELTFEVEVSGEGASWELTVAKDTPWLSISVTAGGVGKTAVTVTAEKLDSEIPRTSHMLIKEKGGQVVRLGVTQYGIERVFDRKSDSLALVAVYKALDGGAWKVQGIAGYPWKLKSPMNTWEGVTTEAIDGQVRVVGLKLTAQGMSGRQIPAELYNLRACRDMEINAEKISGGDVGEGIVLMKNLERFVVKLGTSISWDIPGTATMMKALKTLELYDVTVKVEALSQLYLMTGMEKLVLQCGSFRGDMPDGISKMTNLHTLSIPTLKNVKKLPSDLTQCKNLKNLQLYGAFNVTLPEDIGSMTEMEHLELQLNGEAVIPASVKNMTKLRYFGVTDTVHLGGVSGNLDELLVGMNDLEEVHISGCRFTGTINWMKGKNKIKVAEFQENALTGDLNFTENLPTSMEILNFSGAAGLTGNLNGIGRATKLQVFGISDSQVGGEIPAEIGMCTELTQIYLDKNMFTGNIPVELVKRKWLNGFRVDKNRLGGNGAVLSDDVYAALKARFVIVERVCVQQEGYGFANCPGFDEKGYYLPW